MKNGEKFKTAEERVMAFNAYCDNNSCQKCFDDGHIYSVPCLLKWLDLEAEEEKPLPCPFCGGDVIVSDRQVYCADETDCNYGSGRRNSRDEAIAAHNRFARAVMEAEKKGED